MFRSMKFQTLSALVLASLLPMAAIAATGTTPPAKTTTRTAARHTTAPSKVKMAEAAHKKHATAHCASHRASLDINSASKEELTALPGVTDEIAQKIIDHRPYRSKAELTSKQVITKAEYAKIRAHVVAKQASSMKSEGTKAPESSTPTESAAPDAAPGSN